MNRARLPSNIVRCRPLHLVLLAEQMRDSEQAQFLAITGGQTYDPDTAAHALVGAWARSAPYALTVLRDNGSVAAAGGFECLGNGIWQSWMVGTEEGWAEQWRSMTKATRWLMDQVFMNGARRVQTNALASRTKAIEWFERSLGLQPEGVWRGYGANGEDIAHFSRMRGAPWA